MRRNYNRLSQTELIQIIYRQEDTITFLKDRDNKVKAKIVDRLQDLKDGKKDWSKLSTPQKLTVLKNAVFALLANELE